MSLLVAEISDDYILGIDFLSATNAEESLRSALGLTGKEFDYARLNFQKDEIPLRELFERDSENLDSSQKEMYAKVLRDYQDVFSEEVIAGNCDLIKHEIDVGNSHPIKQTPRRIPLHLSAEVEKEIKEMEKQDVIEKSQSPWLSPAVMVRKKDGSLRFCVDF